LYSSLAVVSTTFVLVACASDPPSNTGGAGGSGGGGGGAGDLVVGGDRPVTVYVPAGVDPAKPSPLFILLHGYGASGFVQELLFQLRPQADAHGFLYAFPDGTVDGGGKRFWNATDACCNFDGSTVDDVAYLSGLVDEIGQHYKVDPKRVYFLGHSNGGFMSHRLACDRADLVAGVASLAGATWLDPTMCNPSKPIAVLQIHGTADDTVLYGGEEIAGVGYPGAVATTEAWAQKNGCAMTSEAGVAIDIEATNDGPETSVSRYESGCQPGGAAELWTIEGGTHVPGLGPEFAPKVVEWLLAHPKP
jgi:polyhydroxybutyrate depolymerase